MTFLCKVAPTVGSLFVHSKPMNDVNAHGTYAAFAICTSDCHADWVTARHAPWSSSPVPPHSLTRTWCAAAIAFSPPLPCARYVWQSAPNGCCGSNRLPLESEPHAYAT